MRAIPALARPTMLQRRACLAAMVVLLLASAATTASAGAVTITAQWHARVGSGGANGTATINVFGGGTGSLAVALKGLAHATIYSETVQKGTCAKPGAKLLTLSTLKTTATGTAARTNTLTAAQATAINKAGEIIRFLAGTHVFCGAFAKVALPPPPPPVGTIAATITVGYVPQDVVPTATAIYVANGDNSISKLDPTTNTALSSIPLGDPGKGFPSAIAVGDDGSLWVAVQLYDSSNDPVAGNVLRVDPASGQIKATVAVGKLPLDVVTSPGAVWVTTYDDDTITRIDTSTNQITDLVVLANAAPVGLAYDFGSIWVTAEGQGRVYRIDPATKQPGAPVQTVAVPEGVATGAGAVWVANYGHQGQADGVLSRIDPTTNQVVRTIPLGMNPLWIAYGGGFVWVAMTGEPTVVQVDAVTNTVVGKITLGGPSAGIAATDHAAWVVQPNEAGLQAKPPVPGTVTRIKF
jgi:streptogramin lyase